MTRKEITSLILLALVILFGIYKFVTSEDDFTGSKFLNYTPSMQGKNLKTEICVISDKNNADVITKEAFNYMQELIYKFSDEYEESIVYRLNNSNGEKFRMDEDMYNLLEKARLMYEISEGHFDITIKPVYDLWDFESAEGNNSELNAKLIPDSLEINSKLKLVDFSKLVYDKEYIVLPVGMKLTFGAIAKGYIVDKTVEFLQSKGAKAGYVNQTSSIRYFGELSKEIFLGIQHPRDNSAIIAQLTNLNGMSVATSGDYQQYFDVGNTRYHHIIDAKTGYPSEENVSVTILTSSAFEADALSTALFLISNDKAVNYLKTLADTDGIFYSDTYDEIGQTWEAISTKTEKTEKSKGMDYYLYNEFIDGE